VREFHAVLDAIMKPDLEPRADRWEYGSEFHWPGRLGVPGAPPVPTDARLYASGRDALAALIQWGRQRRGWRRWFLPTYFCPDVVAAIEATGIEVVRYEDSPRWPVPPRPDVPFCAGDAYLLVNYFGLRGREAAAAFDLGPAELVEDHTHDPWSRWAHTSRAHYVLASLRKTLPIPDGAALWSPGGCPLPDRAPLGTGRETAVLQKAAAMVLKRLYLQGQFDDKPAFRGLQIAGEDSIAAGPISGVSELTEQILPALPWHAWRSRRARNFAVLRQALQDLDGLDVLAPQSADTCPLAVILEFRSPELREWVRTRLIAAAIYPAVHWPVASHGADALRAAAGLSRRLLTLPCDYRYDAADLGRVADAVRQAVREAG
jgi:hypothetical protein